MCLKPFTRPRLGEPLSPERDCISLKQKLSAWARARARVRSSSCKSRLGEAGSLGRELWVSPLFILQQPHNHIPTTTHVHPMFYTSTTAIQSWETTTNVQESIFKQGSLASLTWKGLAGDLNTTRVEQNIRGAPYRTLTGKNTKT